MGSANDLASLSDLKSWLAISNGDDDPLLGSLISETSRSILAYLGRPSILPTNYLDTFDGGYEVSLMLRQWPVMSVLSCTMNGISIPASTCSGSTVSMGYVVDAPDGIPPGRMQRLSLRGGAFPCGIQNVSVSYYAGYQVTNEPGIVPSSGPFEVIVQSPYGNFASDVSVTATSGTPFGKVQANPRTGQYACVDGVYTFSGADAGTTVQITYGYVPGDLARCCIEWAADRYQYRTRIGQHTKSLGGQESVSFIVKDIPDFVRTILQPYRRVVMS